MAYFICFGVKCMWVLVPRAQTCNGGRDGLNAAFSMYDPPQMRLLPGVGPKLVVLTSSGPAHMMAIPDALPEYGA